MQSNDLFVSKGMKLHKGKYNYKFVKYAGAFTKVEITCPIHGVFSQTPDNHLNKKQGVFMFS